MAEGVGIVLGVGAWLYVMQGYVRWREEGDAWKREEPVI